MRTSFARKPFAFPILVVVVSLVGGCSKSLPDEGANAKSVHFENLNRAHYIEISWWQPLEARLQPVDAGQLI